MKLKPLVLVSIITACATLSPEVSRIQAHPNYATLTDAELSVIEGIMNIALISGRKEYYFAKLTELLDTETVPATRTALLNRAAMYRSVEETENKLKDLPDLNEYLTREEVYELQINPHWFGYRPEGSDQFFRVATENDLDLLVNIRVHLIGEPHDTQLVELMEDSIEKHLGRPGFSVNLIFVPEYNEDDDTFAVEVNPNEWTSSLNWAGDHLALAHETMHLMGLDDEYDRIESHATNKYMDRLQRLYQFRRQMVSVALPDARYGIMMFHNKKPLNRQICAAVGLGQECVKNRIKAYGEY